METENKNIRTERELETRIMSIGDIHGTSTWKTHIFGSLNAYKEWKSELDYSETVPDFKSINPNDLDKIIFIGDYVDSFTKSDKQILNNLIELIHFKKCYPNNVVLIIGNHDFHYIMNDVYYSGYRDSMKQDLQNLYIDNMDCFQLAYECQGIVEGELLNTIWTHAGITVGWLNELKLLHTINQENLAETLNSAWKNRKLLKNIIGAVDRASGGWDLCAGPIWVRPEQLLNDAVLGYNQIVGHTPQKDINTVPSQKIYFGLRIDQITFIDVLERGSDKVLIQSY